MSGPGRIESWMRRGLLAAVAGALATFAAAGIARAQDDADIAGGLQDAIVGAWAGQAAQPEKDPFEVRLTFVSPKGGVSRYPGDPPCGGMLVGDRKGDAYEFKESITYGGHRRKVRRLPQRDDESHRRGRRPQVRMDVALQRPGFFIDRRAQTAGRAQEALGPPVRSERGATVACC